MTRVLEVSTAEDVTGHNNSVAITAPDRVTFVKGTCPEESKWWLNILAAFPKSKGRHKRNATFPGGQTTTTATTNAINNVVNGRNRHNSYHKDPLTITNNNNNNNNNVNNNNSNNNNNDMDSWEKNNSDSTPGTPVGGQDENNKNVGNELTNRATTTSLLIEDVRRGEKLKDIANTITNLSQTNCCWSNNSTTISTTKTTNKQQQEVVLDEKPTRDETDFHHNNHHTQQTVVNIRPKSLPLASSTGPAIVAAIVKKIPPVVTSNNNSNNNTNNNNNNINNNNNNKNINNNNINQSTTTTITTTSVASNKNGSIKNLSSNDKLINKSSPRLQQLKLQSMNQYNRLTPLSKSNERGDPDGGCNLDDLSNNYLSKNSELRVNLPAEEILNSKKGWLMKQDIRTGEWSKHWFTLRGAALFFYRDPVSEERGVLDGVLDVNSLTNISELTTSRSFGFQLTTWDNRRVILASISANSRNNWINVLKSAAGLQPKPTKTEPKTVDNMETDLIINENNSNNNNNTNKDLKTEIEKDFIKAQRNQDMLINKIVIHESSPTKEQPPPTPAIIIKPSPTTPVTPLTSKSILFSSDEEYRTASEGGRRESVDWGSPLSPSPPIPLALFRAKERMRNRAGGTSPRLHKRSRSSPPSSRRSTVDSIGSDELPLIHPVQEELNIGRELQQRLGAAEKERDILREEAKEREARMSELLTTLERTELEMTARMREMEEARDKLSRQLDETNNNAEEVVNRLTLELEECQKKVSDLEDRLSRGIEENETLYKKLREMEGSNSSLSNLNRSKMKRLDSLSDLTNLTEIDPFCLDRDMLADEYTELRSRFEKAVNEIKAMKKELKESQNQYDSLEISYAALKQDLERRDLQDKSQLQMMAERIQDLTLKYSSSEKQVRTLKQKLAKSERRRSLSLKGKEQLTLSKELEIKVSELETKVDDLEKSSSLDKVASNSNINQITEVESKASSSKRSSSATAQSRRRSLESSANSTDSLQFMVRLNDLEKRIESAALNTNNTKSDKTSIKKSSSNPKLSEHLVERLRCLEGVLVSSKDKLEQSLQQLQSLRSSRTRRSVSPITDRKDSFRFVERCLNEVVKLIRESCETCIVSNPIENCQSTTTSGVLLLPDSSPIKLALTQLEMQLRNKLSDLLKQRRVLRERNELTSRKDLELLSERIAFESVVFGKLRDSIARAENPNLFSEQQTKAEVAETTQLMSILKAKLGGKCAFKPSGSLDILAGVLARRLVCSSYRKDRRTKNFELPPVDQKILDNLLRQQNEINLIAKRYKNNAMESLASGLAAETLSYISSNDAVQGAIQEAWRQAQETVNAELVQSEIAHVMLRSAERFESSITPAFGYTLTSEERLTFENFADAVNDALRKEMDQTIEQLTQCYEESLKKMKRGQWRLHLEQDRKASEGRQLLCEFADIVAHKALVDARICVLKGDYAPQFSSSSKELCEFSIATLQKYENIFDDLANDLQISNPDDMIAEADFNYIYKNRTIDFISDETHIKEISSALGELEESLVVLESTLNPNTTVSLVTQDIENFKGVCFKCRELRKRVDSMMNTAQGLTEPCYECQKLQTNLRNLTNQHENQLKIIKHEHESNISALRKQIEGHLDQIKTLESERSALIEELSLQSNIVEDHEKELEVIQLKLKTKHDECQQRNNDNIDLSERLEETGEKLKDLLNEREKLTNKCARQDEEYASLLQERDYIQAELNKERERSRKLEKRLEMLEREHSKQLECLQEAYRDQLLSHCSDISSIPEEESFRQRYQTEIEQLRTLCEKGLSAMESSHRRIITDLEERHRVEIERLLFEKEQALAEETQATLAALDAMRKAHQSEVQREVARFKQEFLRQFQRGENIGPIREKEEELEELREEILSFSEKYSIKCVENAALEEKLRAANQKLKHLQQMQQLELRNKQFRAHLAADDLSDPNFRHNLVAKGETSCPESEII
ncbi:protein outspread isoform X2 [Condylostylus longicornis]|uniref:protein outspread isoform X2 n=1 Tax=Condylostylus longicornis TaxID=2530218 RepID=UPI00244E4446|nr:protein outspread isoform X2 [Condylostylus longicornis]